MVRNAILMTFYYLNLPQLEPFRCISARSAKKIRIFLRSTRIFLFGRKKWGQNLVCERGGNKIFQNLRGWNLEFSGENPPMKENPAQ